MRILMPIDGSACSKAAVDFVASRATLLKNPTHVELFNVQYPIPMRVTRALSKEIVHAHHDQEAGKILKRPEAKLRRAGATANSRYAVGTIDRDLVEVVRKDPADVIVIGSHGDSGLTHFLFGSVADKIAAACTKPLLILRSELAPKHDSLKVGIALDGSKYGVAAARFIAKHAALLGEKPSVFMVHVAPELETLTVHGWIDRQVKTGILPEHAAAMHQAAFDSVFGPVKTILKDAGIQAKEVQLVGGDAGQEIATYASKNKLDLLVMGSLGFGTNRFSPVGSVANRVASRVRTPLLLIREL